MVSCHVTDCRPRPRPRVAGRVTAKRYTLTYPFLVWKTAGGPARVVGDGLDKLGSLENVGADELSDRANVGPGTRARMIAQCRSVRNTRSRSTPGRWLNLAIATRMPGGSLVLAKLWMSGYRCRFSRAVSFSHPRCRLSVILDTGVRQVDLRRPTPPRPSGRPSTGWLTYHCGIIPGRRVRGAGRLDDGRQGRRSGSAG